MPAPDTHHPKVFISYSHDSLEHSDRVRELSDRLRGDGIDCVLDQYEVSPPVGWPRWMDKQIRDADFVLMICTETYYRRVMGEEKPGAGLGVRWEGNLIYQHIYNPGAVNERFIPVLLESSHVGHVPVPLQGATYYFAGTDDGYEALYRRLTDQPRHLKPELGTVRKLEPVSRGLRKLEPLEPKERKQDFLAASVTNLPFERNPFFTGREKLLTDLHTAFGKKTTTAQTQAISGLGGLGKSQVAIEFAYRYRDDYNAVFWVRSDSQLALSSGFGEIARLLNLPEKDAQNPEDIVRAVNRWLENNPGWLLIFDNADEPEMLKEFRPRNANGHFLLTSRAQVFDALGVVKPIEIDVMSPEESVKFLFTRTGRDDNNAKEKSAAAEIAEETGYLPLALEQAGAFVNAKKARFQDYLAGYRKRRLELLKESRPVTGDYPGSVATTWSINFQEVQKASEASSDLLRASAFLSPDRIPLELISKGKSELGPALSDALADVEEDPLVLHKVLEPLTRYSFIRLDADSQTYNIHRLVQEVVRDGMDENTQRLWVERVVRALNQSFPTVEFGNWRLCERLLPHARVAAKLIEKSDLEFEEAARLLNQVGLYSRERGRYSEAVRLLARPLAIYEKVLGPEHPDVAVSLNNLALLYDHQGKYAEAEQLYQRSLAIREKVLGPEHLDVALGLNNLAGLYDNRGKYAKAEPLYQRSLAILEKALGPEHPTVAVSLNNLSELYRKQERYAEAEVLQKRSLEIRETVLGSEHPDVARGLNNLAALYQGQGKYAEAEPLFERSLTIRQKVLGNDHPDLAFSFNNLAMLNATQGKHAEAESLFRQSLAIFEQALGLNHPSVATVLENLAILLQATGRPAEAMELNIRSAAIRAKYSAQSEPPAGRLNSAK